MHDVVPILGLDALRQRVPADQHQRIVHEVYNFDPNDIQEVVMTYFTEQTMCSKLQGVYLNTNLDCKTTEEERDHRDATLLSHVQLVKQRLIQSKEMGLDAIEHIQAMIHKSPKERPTPDTLLQLG